MELKIKRGDKMEKVSKVINSVSENNIGINLNDEYFICHIFCCAL